MKTSPLRACLNNRSEAPFWSSSSSSVFRGGSSTRTRTTTRTGAPGLSGGGRSKATSSHPEATSKPTASQPIATPKPLQSHPKATSKPPQSRLKTSKDRGDDANSSFRSAILIATHAAWSARLRRNGMYSRSPGHHRSTGARTSCPLGPSLNHSRTLVNLGRPKRTGCPRAAGNARIGTPFEL
jgi:hypothetical protein